MIIEYQQKKFFYVYFFLLVYVYVFIPVLLIQIENILYVFMFCLEWCKVTDKMYTIEICEENSEWCLSFFILFQLRNYSVISDQQLSNSTSHIQQKTRKQTCWPLYIVKTAFYPQMLTSVSRNRLSEINNVTSVLISSNQQ